MGRVSNAKETLMNAVLELIWQGSYGSTTIDQICEKAGVKFGVNFHNRPDDNELPLGVRSTAIRWSSKDGQRERFCVPSCVNWRSMRSRRSSRF